MSRMILPRKMGKKKKPRVKILPRSAWGARSPTASRTPHTPMEIVVHHTVYPTLSQTATPKREHERMRTIQAQHQGQGWIDFAYHLCIFPSGRVYRGRPLRTIGSHVANQNTGRVGIVFDGNFETRRPSEKALASYRYLKKHHPVLKNLHPTRPHRSFGGTACPGKFLIDALFNH